MLLRFITVLLLLLVIIACQKPPQAFQSQILSFGTKVDITLYGIEQAQAKKAIQHIEQQLDIMHEQWHAWRKSTLTKLNQQLVTNKPFQADAAILPLVLESQQLYIRSQGLFNPAIGKLIELWGFYRDNPQSNTSIPPAAEIQRLVNSNPNMCNIIIAGNTLTGTNTDLQLDFGGYAKGYGIDRLVEQLKAQGITNALINAGGDLRAIGRAGDRAWRIAIQHPDKEQPLAWFEAEEDESVFSSGDYQRRFFNENKKYHHIIDPRTGYPTNNAKAVTVVHKSGAIADAAATALMVASADQWLDIAKNLELKHLLVVDQDGQLYSDKLFAQRLNLIEKNMTIRLLGTL